MICQGCGYEQATGEVCIQCMTPLTPVVPESNPDDESPQRSGPLKERRKGERRKSFKMAPRPVQEPEEQPPEPTAIKPESQNPKLPPEQPSPPLEKKSQGLPPVSPISAEIKKTLLAPDDAPVTPLAPQDLAQNAPRVQRQPLEQVMVTTTPRMEGRPILSYHGVVSATALIKGDRLRAFIQGEAQEVIGARSSPMGKVLEKAWTLALEDLKASAVQRGANAVVGLTMSPVAGPDGYWIHLTGTAVTLKD